MIADRLGRQLEVLRSILELSFAADSLTGRRLRHAGIATPGDLAAFVDLQRLPLLARADLIADQQTHPPYGTNLSHDLSRYVRAVRSAGTSGAPRLLWLHSLEDLAWRTTLWRAALAGVGVRQGDVALVERATPEGFDRALADTGVLTVPTTSDHVQDVRVYAATVLVGQPSDALRLVEAAALTTNDLTLRLVVLSGAPGANMPSTRRRIEKGLGARCADVYWLVEAGAVGWQCPILTDGIHLNEDAFIVECVDPASGESAAGSPGELVLTSLGQVGMPLIRYRTRDLVRLGGRECGCGSAHVIAEGGVLGRVDEVLVLRGVTVLPADIEDIARRHPAVIDCRLARYHAAGSSTVTVNVEPNAAVASEGDRARVAAEVAADIRRSLGVLLQCEVVPPGTLTRR